MGFINVEIFHVMNHEIRVWYREFNNEHVMEIFESKDISLVRKNQIFVEY